MKCPKCGSSTKVYEKRWWDVDNKQGKDMRRRVCDKCGFRFKTLETYFEPVRRQKDKTDIL